MWFACSGRCRLLRGAALGGGSSRCHGGTGNVDISVTALVRMRAEVWRGWAVDDVFYLITIVRIWLSPCFNGRRYDEVTDIAGYSTAVPGKMSMIVFSSYHWALHSNWIWKPRVQQLKITFDIICCWYCFTVFLWSELLVRFRRLGNLPLGSLHLDACSCWLCMTFVSLWKGGMCMTFDSDDDADDDDDVGDFCF